jgi:hypothetical protein
MQLALYLSIALPRPIRLPLLTTTSLLVAALDGVRLANVTSYQDVHAHASKNIKFEDSVGGKSVEEEHRHHDIVCLRARGNDPTCH